MHTLTDLQNLKIADKLLTEFVNQIPKLYGETTLVFNVHTLRHLIQDVKRHGSLSQHSMFALEGSSGYFKKKIHGTTSLSSQFIKGKLIKIKIC